MVSLLSRFESDYHEIKNLLLYHSELSLQTSVEMHFRKTFLLSCASYHENCIQDMIGKLLAKQTLDERVICFATSNLGKKKRKSIQEVTKESGKREKV